MLLNKDMAEEHLKRIKIFHGAFDDEDIDICRFEKLHWTTTGDNKQLLELLFKAFNAPDHYLTEEEEKLNKEYRAQKLRSLSVGDIVQIDGKRYKCAPVGWEEIQSVMAFEARNEMLTKIDKMIKERQ